MPTPFYGREDELDRLQRLRKKKTSSLVVIRGRRRIGKSRLILEFSKGIKSLIFTGLPPEPQTTAQMQRDDFLQQMKNVLGLRGLKADDWGDLFWQLAQQVKEGPTLLVLDEINWMGSLDSTFLGKLKSAWDLYFKNNPQLILILSGSMSRWIEKNILSSTGFMGRSSLVLTINELPLGICNLFWRRQAKLVSAYEKFKVLAVTGGVPRYLEELDPTLSAEENIYQMGFRKGGILFEEFDRIFSDLFSKRSHSYELIVKCLSGGPADLNSICDATGLQKGGTVSEYLEDLVETGYIARDYTWSLKSGKESKLSHFRLSDNYLRFYLKYILPRKAQIERNRIQSLPSWEGIMGLQFENLVLNNVDALHHVLNLDPSKITYDNPYFQRATKERAGCQVDYLIQTKYNRLILCEVKFSKDKIGPAVIQEVQEKITRIHSGKRCSFSPVLIHVNGVHDSVVESDFFSHIVDFGQLLTT